MADTHEGFVRSVERLVRERINEAVTPVAGAEVAEALGPGKMLRTRLAARLVTCGAAPADVERCRLLCAATEIAHTATLCHDDIIDNAFLRRRRPALWRSIGANAAVLAGDLLLCASYALVAQTGDPACVAGFARKLSEVCSAEAEEELGVPVDVRDAETCLRLARGTTGPLFAVVARAAAEPEGTLPDALEEAGYLIGTAYQLADDLLDVVGDPDQAGKTLRRDALRGKATLPGVSEHGRRETRARVRALCLQALQTLNSWPSARRAVRTFLSEDLQPVLDRHIRNMSLLSVQTGQRTRPGTDP